MRPHRVAAVLLVWLTWTPGWVQAQEVPARRTVTLEVTILEGDPQGSREKGTLRICAAPRIITLEGRPAQYIMGAKLPTADEMARGLKPRGVTIGLLPFRMGDGRIRLEVDYPGRDGGRKHAVHALKSGHKVKVELRKSHTGAGRWAVVKVQAEPRLVDRDNALVPALLAALARARTATFDPTKDVEGAVNEAVLTLGTDAVPGLIAVLRGKDRTQRAAAAILLGRLAEKGHSVVEAIPALVRAARDEDLEVSGEAAIALSKIIKTGR